MDLSATMTHIPKYYIYMTKSRIKDSWPPESQAIAVISQSNSISATISSVPELGNALWNKVRTLDFAIATCELQELLIKIFPVVVQFSSLNRRSILCVDIRDTPCKLDTSEQLRMP